MTRGRGTAAALALLGALAAVGCGIGPGKRSSGDAVLTVTRDYGAKQVLEARESNPRTSDTVLRFLDREAKVTTRYGGRFVQSIDGISGTGATGRKLDWFFYVNGIESPVGAAEVHVHGGDRIWWDYRDWSAAMRVPAVVGSWPEPFLNGSGRERAAVGVVCLGARVSCRAAADRLRESGVRPRPIGSGAGGGRWPRVLVGPWRRVRKDRAAAQIEDGPAESGVFATFAPRGGGYRLTGMDQRGSPSRRLGRGAGLVAAVRLGDRKPTWVVTGTDEAGVRAATDLLRDDVLRDRYAVAEPGRGESLPLPTP
jgi:uncharacterized protein DUF4430